MATIKHPGIPGSERDVADSSVPFHQAAGWVVVGSEDDPDVKGAAERPGGGDVEADAPKEAPKTRRGTTKDGDD